MPTPKPRDEKPCCFCGDLTAERYSWDMDLPALPFCDRMCAISWGIIQRKPIRGDADA